MSHPSCSLVNTTLKQEHGWISSDIPFTIHPLQFDIK
jgi:hypothetical protein